MSQNPFEKPLEHARCKCNELQALAASLDAKINGYESFSVEDAQKTLEKVQSDVRLLTLNRDKYEAEYLRISEESLKADNAYKNERLNPASWIRGSVSTLRQAAEQITEKAVLQLKTCRATNEQLKLAKEKAEKLEAALSKFTELNGSIKVTKADKEAIIASLAEAQASEKQLLLKWRELEEALAPLRESEITFKGRIRDLEQEIELAESLDQRLSTAQTPKDRRLVHAECEKHFEESKPSLVISNRRERLKDPKRQLKKLQVRMREIIKNHTRQIAGLIIDGSNLCYFNDDGNYAGLDAVIAVANHLAATYPVTVVFDASIRGKAKMKNAEIRSCFSENVTVQVMPPKGKADGLLLKEAAAANMWIISNDRFVDYPEEPAVAEERLLTHTEFNRVLRIEGLNLALPF